MRTARAFVLAVVVLAWLPVMRAAGKHAGPSPEFHTSDRCLACHNGLTTSRGQDISIGIDWRSSIMANSARDPYWQGSVRRETIDHPESSAEIQDECSTCHMPVSHFTAESKGKKPAVFAYLPVNADKPGHA